MEFFRLLIDLLRHLGQDDKWQAMVSYVGVNNLYFVLCAIVFVETGLVIMPFLPGDSLIFAVGAIAGREVGIDIKLIGPLLVCAALLGDNVNYWLGRRVGPAVFRMEEPKWNDVPSGTEVTYETPRLKSSLTSRLLNKKHLTQAHEFYEKYGTKTVILARFVPIVRTFAPFVAGIAKMNYVRFLIFSVIGAVLWVSLCLTGGYYLGSRPFFKQHFEFVVLVIVAVSLIPVLVEFVKARRRGHASRASATAGAETSATHRSTM